MLERLVTAEVLDLAGRRIDSLTFDYRVTVTVDDGSWVIWESPFTYAGESGSGTLDPERPGADASGLLQLMATLHTTVVRAEITGSGALVVEFHGGLVCTAPASDGPEAWSAYVASSGARY